MTQAQLPLLLFSKWLRPTLVNHIKYVNWLICITSPNYFVHIGMGNLHINMVESTNINNVHLQTSESMRASQICLEDYLQFVHIFKIISVLPKNKHQWKISNVCMAEIGWAFNPSTAHATHTNLQIVIQIKPTWMDTTLSLLSILPTSH